MAVHNVAGQVSRPANAAAPPLRKPASAGSVLELEPIEADRA